MAKGNTGFAKQDKISQQFLSLAKRKNHTDKTSATAQAIRNGKAEKVKFEKMKSQERKTETVFLNGIEFKVSPEKAAEIREKNEREIFNR